MNKPFLADRIDGKGYAADLVEKLTDEVAEIKSKTGLTPGLAVILVGEDPASGVYVGAKHRQTLAIGMESFVHRLAVDTTQTELMTLLEELNAASEVNGILVQLPLPAHLDTNAVINAIDPNKDVDGFHILNAGRLATGQDALVPCTPLGCLMMLKDRIGSLAGLHAVVVGKSNIVGKPMAQLLMAENCTVTVAHSKTKDVPALCRTADILVVAVGRPELVKGDWIKAGAVVIDVGINRIDRDGRSRIVGDVAFDEAGHASAITPVPGGVGPMTIACLLANTVTAFKRQHHIVTNQAAVAV
ncbi:bifunctional methylenetetrahydrofolate dehydrogenase/methenyltetrahydrofolate cyclohydrolase FolD [Pseudomonas sp. KB_15]|uniref:bifunctional methylenetetrahydrofolate dehydrogenase/methenyltetrahydrofolate cyclohydrolase FolD n=1 Tax=Pseudomonas sp. KB_15 TaxID=3233035 RepID=UPI003F96F825